jgi:GNAT superfamily N-acetyltransferase
MVEIKELSEQNFGHFLNLLLERGEAPEDYYKWKYLQQPNNFFPIGFIAYLDIVPVGCIGIINKVYMDENLIEHPATWFADWFVSENARGKGVGIALMRKVYELSKYAFGIPGPKNAQLVAKKAGYIPQERFLEVLLPCKSIKFGFFRYKDFIGKRIMRAIALGVIFSFRSPSINIKYTIEELNDFSEIRGVSKKLKGSGINY